MPKPDLNKYPWLKGRITNKLRDTERMRKEILSIIQAYFAVGATALYLPKEYLTVPEVLFTLKDMFTDIILPPQNIRFIDVNTVEAEWFLSRNSRITIQIEFVIHTSHNAIMHVNFEIFYPGQEPGRKKKRRITRMTCNKAFEQLHQILESFKVRHPKEFL